VEAKKRLGITVEQVTPMLAENIGWRAKMDCLFRGAKREAWRQPQD
jgi:hypothetical protein